MAKELTETTEEYNASVEAMHEDYQPPRNTALALIPMGHAAISPVHGIEIDAQADFDAKVAAIATIDSMIAGDAEHIDKYLNTVVWAIGVVQHNATVRTDSDELRDATRTVLHVCATKGKEHEVVAFSFVSSAVANYFEQRIIPLFGIRFERPLGFRFSKVATRKGSTYSIQLVSDVQYPNFQ